ncbi:hypothetical protein Y032_0008g362 [Ancylostoma ceylanicum]|nr:hypothetical protein Y032_0008g362 [Ancylostoma ceylanicum]
MPSHCARSPEFAGMLVRERRQLPLRATRHCCMRRKKYRPLSLGATEIKKKHCANSKGFSLYPRLSNLNSIKSFDPHQRYGACSW